ncbi:sulfurtransferase complex subunit TusC [Vibrio gangliei]|uniref:sulfurtransferase complex subunit TusC n=1 Tax=Vibrio gangliei TaxID=2077090 RepID=UPI000D015F2A|nr:sulfurtransferase complex subunit TusC [Vibrio gangliei]
MRLGFVFRSYPHSTSQGREGLDALLAASAYCEDIDVFFIDSGVTQLMASQQPEKILSRDYISAFKLLDLYDIDNVYVCDSALQDYQLSAKDLVLDVQVLDRPSLVEKLHQCQKIMTF